jgi:hypothetical protein
MSEKPRDKQKEQPRRSEAADRAAEERETRLAAALRANLRRRKAQVRHRGTEPAPDEPKS